MNPVAICCWAAFITIVISIAMMMRGESIQSDFHKYVSIGIKASDGGISPVLRASRDDATDKNSLRVNALMDIEGIGNIGGTSSGKLFASNTNGGITIENGLIKDWNILSKTGTIRAITGFKYYQYDNATKLTSMNYIDMVFKNGLLESTTTGEYQL